MPTRPRGRWPDGSGQASLQSIFNFENYGELLVLVQNSIWAGAVLGLLGGLVGTFVMKRDLAFAVHGISELSFAGAAFALLIGADIVFGSLIGSVAAALLLGLMGVRARDKNSIIGVIMPFGLGLGILFLSLYEGRAANKFGLLTGQIVSVDTVQLQVLAGTAVVVMAALVRDLAAAELRQRRPRTGRGPRRSRADAGAGLHGAAGRQRGAVDPDGGRAAGSGPADHAGGGCPAGDVLARGWWWS